MKHLLAWYTCASSCFILCVQSIYCSTQVRWYRVICFIMYQPLEQSGLHLVFCI